MRLNIYLIFPLLLFSCAINANNRPGFVCGKFNNTIVEVPSDYVYNFAEYEGYSYFDPRFIKNKKGCEANFRVLPLRMSWPEMKPVDYDEYTTKKKTIRVSIEPLNDKLKGYLEHERYIYLDWGEEKIKGDVVYDEKLGLYFIEVKLKKITKYSDSENDKFGYYWRIDNDEITDFFRCIWVIPKQKYSRCNGVFLVPEYKIKVEVKLSIEELIIWDEMKNTTINFINQYIKK